MSISILIWFLMASTLATLIGALVLDRGYPEGSARAARMPSHPYGPARLRQRDCAPIPYGAARGQRPPRPRSRVRGEVR